MPVKTKLSHDQRMVVLRMYAEGIEVGKIQREVKTEFGITITHKGLSDTCKAKKNQPFVKAFRDDYLAKVKSVPIANKRVRIDDLEKQRNKLIKLIDGNPLKSKADKELYMRLLRELRMLIDTAREEMEKKPHLFQNVVVGMGGMSDEALHERKQRLIKKLRGPVGGGTPGIGPDSGGVGQEDQE